MPLAEAGVLVLILDNLRHVVAEDMSHGVLGFDQLHTHTSLPFAAHNGGAVNTVYFTIFVRRISTVPFGIVGFINDFVG